MDIELINFDTTLADKEHIKNQIKSMVETTLNQSNQADKLFIVNINTGDIPVEATKRVMHAVKEMCESRGLTNAIYIPNNTVSFTEVRVVRE